MKNITITLVCLFIVTLTFGQTLPKSLDGQIKYSQNNYIDFAKASKAITRSSNRVSIKLDSVVYFLPEKKDYYANFIIELYADKGGEPLTSMSYLIKDILSQREGKDKKQILTNQTLASGLNFDNVKFLKLKCELVKIANNEDAINNTLNGFLNQMIESVPYVNLVNTLLEKQNGKEKTLFFNREYDIPLNNVEFAFKKQTDDKGRLLSSVQPIYIPIENKINNEFLDASVAGFVFKKLCQVSKLTTGIKTTDGKLFDFNGMIKLRITNDDNLNIPKYLQNSLQDYVLAVAPSTTSTDDFAQVKEKLQENLRTFKESEEYDQKIYFSIQQLMVLGEAYQKLLDKDIIFNGALVNGTAPARAEFQHFHRTFKEFYERTSFQQDQFDFLAYGIYNSIYPNEWVRIFIPYSLTDIANNEVIRWQIGIHERLNTYNNGEFRIPFRE